jgi:hypothetical protein
MQLEKARVVQHVRAQFALVETGVQRAAVIVVAGVAADRRQAVGREGEKSFDRSAARHIFDTKD